MKNNCCVYIHIFPNGKVYIGQTSQSTAQRWVRGKGYKGQFVERAIKKYGWDNIEHRVLYSGLNEEEANKYEIELIAEYKSNDERYGYNLQAGGKDKGDNLEHSKEHYKKVSEVNSKSVDCYSRDGSFIATFKSIMSASAFVNGKFKVISACCCGTKKSAYGYIWRFHNDAFNKYETRNKKGGAKGFSIDVYSLDGSYICTFKTIKSASEQLGISKDSIFRVLKGRGKSTRQYVFKYVNEENNNDEDE